MLGLLASSSVCGNDLPLTQPQISIIRAQRVQECSTAAPSPSLFISLPLSLLPHLRLALLLPLLLALNPSLALVAFLRSIPPSLLPLDLSHPLLCFLPDLLL